MHNPASEPRRLRVFLCHGSEDKAAVRSLYTRLLDEGFDPWLDELKLIAGTDWETEIRKAVRQSDAVLVCLSRTSIARRGVVQREIRYALDVALDEPEGAIFLIPARLDDVALPDSLASKQWVNLFDPDGYRRLVEALRVCSRSKGVTDVAFSLLSVLVVELRGATVLMEQLQPHEISTVLNRFYLAVTGFITQNHGTVTTYLGETVVAVFQRPDHHADDAVLAARHIVGKVQRIRISEAADVGQESVAVSAGVSTGEAITGVMGTGTLAAFAAVGPEVDLAWRVGSLPKQFAEPIVITDETVKRLTLPHQVRLLGEVAVKGGSRARLLYGVDPTTLDDEQINPSAT